MKKILSLFFCVIMLVSCTPLLTGCLSDPMEGKFILHVSDKTYYESGVSISDGTDYPTIRITKTSTGDYKVIYYRAYWSTKDNKVKVVAPLTAELEFLTLEKSPSDDKMYIGESNYNLFCENTSNTCQYTFKANGNKLTVTCVDGDSGKTTTYTLERTSMSDAQILEHIEEAYTK